MNDQLTCGGDRPCIHWQAEPGRHRGDCMMRVCYHRPAFDYQPDDGPCQYHSELGTTPAPTIELQSQTRGSTPWRQFWP